MPWTFFNSSGEQMIEDGAAIAATQAEMEAASATGDAAFVTPGRTQYHPGVAKVWWHIAAAGSLSSPDYGVSSVGDTSAGLRAINFTTAFSSAVYAISSSIAAGSMELQAWFDNFATGSVRHGISLSISGYTATDTITTGSIHGDQ